MLRIVLDTNVLVSGLLNPHGSPGRVIDLVLSRELKLLYDDRILSEYVEVLARPRLNIPQDDAAMVIHFIRLSGEHVTALPLPQELLPDPTDLPFAEVAASGRADFLVTGNTRHFPNLDDRGIVALSPTDLLQQWR